MGAGTTTVDSGFMEALEREFGSALSVVAGSTAELLRLADQGVVDVVIVHDEAQEMAFMADHPDAVRAPAFDSEFLLVGPAAEVGRLAVLTVADAFAVIAAHRPRLETNRLVLQSKSGRRDTQ